MVEKSECIDLSATGMWIRHHEADDIDSFECSHCGECFSDTSPYCPECGTKMSNPELSPSKDYDCVSDDWIDVNAAVPDEGVRVIVLLDGYEENDDRMCFAHLTHPTANENCWVSDDGHEWITVVAWMHRPKIGPCTTLSKNKKEERK